MTITTTFRWNGKLGSDWNADIPNPPGPNLINWDVLDGPNPPPGPPSGDGDLAVIDLGGDIDISAPDSPGGAEEIQIVNGSNVTLGSGHFGAGAEGEAGGMLIDEGAALVITSSATMANQGSLDIVGLTGDGTLTLQPGAGFDDLGMIVGADADAHGVVTVDAAFGFEVAQSGLSATDGVLVIGEDGDGTVDVSDTSIFYSASAILGENKGAVGALTLDNSTWGGSNVTIGAAGVGQATIESGAIVALFDVVVGSMDGGNGDLSVTGANVTVDFLTIGADGTGTATFGAGSTGMFATVTVGESADAIANLTLDGATWNAGSLVIGLAGTGHATAGDGEIITANSIVLGAGEDASGDLALDSASLNGGTVVVGQAGIGDLAIESGSSGSVAAVVVGADDGSSGTLTIDGADWSVGSLTVGLAGDGQVTVGTDATATLDSILIGPTGGLAVTEGAGSVGTVVAQQVTIDFGLLDVSGGGQVLIGPATGDDGAVAIGMLSSLTGLGSLKGDVVLSDGGLVQATAPVPGALTIDGNISGDGTIEPLMTLEVNGGIAAGVTIAFSPSIGAQVGELDLDVPAANLGTITGFSAGNTIVVEGSLYDDALFTQGVSGAAGTLTLSGGTLEPLSFAVEGTYAADSFVATPNVTETDITLCFAAGTRIATPQGEIPVERLTVSDEVLTLRGATRPIVWIGAGKVLATSGRRNAATPVIVRKGALDEDMPRRDLRLTKGHALFIDGVLVPVEELINQRSILWDDRAQELDIYHIELATHDVLLADGAPAESYRDDGNRWLFGNPNTGWHLPPQAPCAPLLNGGPMVDAIWRRLLDRASPPHHPKLTDDADVHLVADGVRSDAIARDGDRAVFRLPICPRTLRIRSRCAVPQELGLARDPRRLGVGLRQIMLGGPRMPMRTARADDACLVGGFHAYEPDNGIRWTNGDAAVPSALLKGLTGPLLCTLEISATTRYLDEGRTLRAA